MFPLADRQVCYISPLVGRDSYVVCVSGFSSQENAESATPRKAHSELEAWIMNWREAFEAWNAEADEKGMLPSDTRAAKWEKKALSYLMECRCHTHEEVKRKAAFLGSSFYLVNSARDYVEGLLSSFAGEKGNAA